MILKIVTMVTILLFLGCVDKSYTYRSIISDANISNYLYSKIKQKEYIYEIETKMRERYFFSKATAKEKLAHEVLQNIKNLCKKYKRRYFAIISPKELSNVSNSLVNREKEFIDALQPESFFKDERQNYATIKVNFILLKEKPLEYIVWDSEAL